MEILTHRMWKLRIFMCFVIVTSIVSMAIVSVPVHAGSTVLSASIIVYDNLTPGSTFSVDVNITDVENLWGYEFRLYHNPTVLYATNVSSNYPFTNKWGSYFNHTAGFVYLAYSMPMGTKIGFSTNETVPTWAIAKIEFLVLEFGTSPLDISNAKLADPTGGVIAYNVYDGFFSNVETLAKCSELLADYNALNETYHSLLIEYNNLLDRYDQLNSTYSSLLASYTQLQSNYTSLQSEYNILSANYSSLETDYNTSKDNYNSLWTLYSSLNFTFNSLKANYEDLKSRHETSTNELSTARNLNYLLVVTTTIFIATTAYFILKKPKVQVTS